MSRVSTASRLRAELNDIVQSLADLIHGIPIESFDRSGGGVVFIVPDYYWGKPSAQERSAQIELKNRYDRFAEIFQLVFSKTPTDVQEQLEEGDKGLRMWLELDSNWSLSPDRENNRQRLQDDTRKLFDLFDVLDAHPEQKVLVVPDTNSLLCSADPVAYRVHAEDTFVFVLLSTVVSELDHLKILHRVPDVRDKAKKVITRIKGWRNQGSLLQGVMVDKTIMVKVESNEPDMHKTLSWLDKDVPDDRIIASTLHIQARYPAARVVLVTADLNLQTKAEAALIEYAELNDT